MLRDEALRPAYGKCLKSDRYRTDFFPRKYFIACNRKSLINTNRPLSHIRINISRLRMFVYRVSRGQTGTSPRDGGGGGVWGGGGGAD